LSVTCKTSSNTLLSRLTPYAQEITGDNQCGFRPNRSTTDHIFCIRQILEKKWEYNEEVHQLFIDLKKGYGSFRREVVYNTLIKFGIPMKNISLIKRCLNEIYSRVWVGTQLSDMLSIKTGLRQEDALSSLLFSVALGSCFSIYFSS
jgi:hypothetical protein